VKLEWRDKKETWDQREKEDSLVQQE